MDGRPNRRNKAPLSSRISVNVKSNRRNKVPFSSQISVEGKSSRRNKAPLSSQISVDVSLAVEIKPRSQINVNGT